MEQPEPFDLARDVLIGTVAGVSANTIENHGTLYVMGSALALWFLLILAMAALRRANQMLSNHTDEDDRPNEEIQYAS